MKPQYLHTGKRRFLNVEELEEKFHAMMATILGHNAHLVRQSSGLVLPDGLTLRFKVCHFLPLVGPEYKQLLTVLAKKKGSLKVPNKDNRCFGYAFAAARASTAPEPTSTASIQPALPDI